MPYNCDYYRRLEPHRPIEDLERGFRAEVHDPVWFLGRQWQMGEHQGEDASSPVEVTYTARQVPLGLIAGLDPTVIPPEAVIESETGDWWTPGRRIALGRAYAAARKLPPPPAADPARLLKNLPVPYDALDGRGYDGYKLWLEDPGHAVFAAVPTTEPPDHWDPVELAYSAKFQAGPVALNLERHDGGDVDWYSVDASGPVGTAGSVTAAVIPTRMRYPGAPHPRWWQIEDARVDMGGFAPDRGHFATLLLIDLVLGHSDDWFTFPVISKTGHVLRLQNVLVRDSFDETWKVTPPADWSLFAVRGLETGSLLLWPGVTMPLQGELLEEVSLGVDEDANLLWAVENRIEGRALPTPEAQPATGGRAAGFDTALQCAGRGAWGAGLGHLLKK